MTTAGSTIGIGWLSLLWLTLSLMPASLALAAGFEAGVAVVDITPPAGEMLAGYPMRRKSDSIHDPLFARVLLLRAGGTSLVFVSSDLNRLQSPLLADRILRELGVDHVILSGSHSHSAPALDANPAKSPWAAKAENQIFDAVRQASQNLFPAGIQWGQGALLGGHNIRITENGRVRERWSNPDEEVSTPITPTVSVIRIDREGGGPQAVIVHYACEPAVLGPDNLQISADYPGALARYVEKEMGNGVVSLFAPGAAANIYPFRARLRGREGFAEIEKMGARLGREVVRVARGLRTSGTENQLGIVETVLTFKNRWRPQEKLEVGVAVVLINNSVLLYAVPGEMFIDFQLALSAKTPSRMSLLLGNSYSGGRSWAGTIPTIAAAAEGGWGASYATEIEVGAGEAIVDHGVIQLLRFLGKLDELPRGILTHEIPDLSSP
jgi:hypothetical protein